MAHSRSSTPKGRRDERTPPIERAEQGAALPAPTPGAPIVLFDGACGLCQGAARFVIRRDPAGRVRLAPLQSAVGRRLLGAHGIDPGDMTTVVLVAGGRAYTRSTAALRVTRYLRPPWPWLRLLLLVPAPLRDLVYDVVARNRARWFGTSGVCERLPPDVAARLLRD